MAFAVLRPLFTRLNERVAHHSDQSTSSWYAVEFSPAQRLNSTTAEAAMAEAKRLGYVRPIVGEVSQ